MSRRHKDAEGGGVFEDTSGGTGGGLLPEAPPPGFRSGFVAVLGRPNVGKSTLVNALVGQKVSIVSDRPQTTRRRIAGVVDALAFQLVLLDLPGFQKPFDALTERMQRTVDETLKEVDAALVVLNAAEMLGGGDRFILAAAQASETPFVVALNKVDLVHGGRLQGALTAAETLAAPAVVHAVSAKTGHNLHLVLERLVESMPEGPRYFPSGEVSDQPLEMLITELVREQALRRTRDEVPHAIAVELASLVEREDKPLLEVEAILIVESESQKGIVIGKGGAVVKQIGTAARREIEAILGTHVFLSLRVKVRRHWRRDDAYVERLL